MDDTPICLTVFASKDHQIFNKHLYLQLKVDILKLYLQRGRRLQRDRIEGQRERGRLCSKRDEEHFTLPLFVASIFPPSHACEKYWSNANITDIIHIYVVHYFYFVSQHFIIVLRFAPILAELSESERSIHSSFYQKN